jgi:hypothetical protein
VSDQDFFFDEDETASQATEGKAAAAKSSVKSASRPAPAERKAASKPAPKAAVKPEVTTPRGPSFFEQSVSMTIAALMTVIGVLAGVIVGFIVAPDSTTVSTGSTATSASAESSAAAPTLTEEQLSSGALPEGHPDISSMSTSETAAATGE